VYRFPIIAKRPVVGVNFFGNGRHINGIDGDPDAGRCVRWRRTREGGRGSKGSNTLARRNDGETYSHPRAGVAAVRFLAGSFIIFVDKFRFDGNYCEV